MKKLLLILLCVPLLFSCGEKNEEKVNDEEKFKIEDNLSKELTIEMIWDGYTGKGTYVFDENSKYIGEWKNGERNGKGTHIDVSYGCVAGGDTNICKDCIPIPCMDTLEYVGEWKDGKKHGQGTMKANGNLGYEYVGEWKRGDYHGKGTYTKSDGRNEYTGEWKSGDYHGKGTYIYSDGDKYVGEFKDGFKHGQGTYTYASGEVYEGLWEDGEFIGE
jgi:hypothetical protein